MRLRTTILISSLLILLAIVVWPQSAHALNLLDVVSSPGAALAALVVGGLEVMQGALVRFVLWLVQILTTVVLQPGLNYGGVAVYTVWKVFRDLCNSFFLVFFILIAFSTIFHSIWKSGAGYYYRSALINVIIAAVLVNFSLPIGQTLVWAGNQATLAVMGLMQGTDIEERLTAALNITSRASDVSPVKSIYAVPDLTKPTEQQNEGQLTITQNFTPQMQAEYEKCNEENLRSQASGGCLAYVMGIHYDQFAESLDTSAKRAAVSAPKSLPWYTNAWNAVKSNVYGLIVSGGAMTPAGGAIFAAQSSLAMAANTAASQADLQSMDMSVLLAKIGVAVGNIVLLLLMSISFLCVIVFMVIRLPMIWFLLAGSAIACFFYAVPKSNRAQTWFGDMVGYNIFGPVYLFAIYIGLLVLSLQSSLLVGLKNAQWYEGLLGAFLFTGIATVIFTGGAAAAWKFAFQFSKDLEKRVTKYGEAVGVSEKSMFGLKSGSAALSRATGATAVYEGGKARVTREFKSMTDRGQKFQETLRARAEGGKARVDLERKRIEEQKKSNKDSGKSNADLKTDLQKSGPAYYAAAGQLLEAGELSPAQMSDYVTRASSISPAYGQAAREQVNKKVIERAKDKKFKTAAEALSALDMYAPNPKDSQEVADSKVRMRDSLLKSLEKSQPLIAADMVAAGHYPGKAPSDIIKANFGALENKDIGEVVDRMESGRLAKDSDFTRLIAAKNRKLSDHLNLMGAISDPQTQAYIFDYMKAHNINPRP